MFSIQSVQSEDKQLEKRGADYRSSGNGKEQVGGFSKELGLDETEQQI